MGEIVGTQGWGPPRSLEGALLAFFHRLRDARVPVSMVEVLDAFACLRHVDLADRTQFRAALFTTLVKRPEDQQAFHVLFDVCFPLTRAPGTASSAPAGGNGHTHGEPGQTEAQAETDAPVPASDELLRALLDALRHDDEAAMRTLAGLAVDRFGGLEAQPGSTERYYLYRILRQVELYRLLAMALGDADDPDGAARHGREELARRIEEFRRLLAEQVRHRLSATVGAEQAAELYRERQLEDVDFLGANAGQLRELRQAVRPLARKLVARAAQRRRLKRRGRLDVRRTVRRSLSSGGVPVDPAFRAVRASKPDLYVLADVSGSVIEFAKFTLSLLHAMNEEFAKMRSFAFVDGIDEVTGILDEGGHRMDLRGAFARARVVAADGHSDYGRVFAGFAERYGADIDTRSTLIVMGDARNNYRQPGLETLKGLRERARRLYWLNPEPRADWDTSDSIMSVYTPWCDRVFEVRNLRQLTACVDEIT
ncbi:MAG TPA: VWA domain-containing protein [Actinomycetota bacterium]|nr:VWA domain-containing protein [Actinomycetota bacterium]